MIESYVTLLTVFIVLQHLYAYCLKLFGRFKPQIFCDNSKPLTRLANKVKLYQLMLSLLWLITLFLYKKDLLIWLTQ